MMSPVRLLSPFLVLVLAAGCSDKADRLAKERIFSPEEPAADLQRAKEAIDVSQAAKDPKVFHRLFAMDRLEATRRLGAQHATTTLQFRWTRAGRTVSLNEKDELFAEPDGPFRAVSTNDQDSGLEVVWAGGKAYAKSRYGPFHARRLDRAEEDTWRDRATPALSTLETLFQGRLHLSPLGHGEHAGRSGERFALALGEPWSAAKDTRDLPPVSFGQYKAPGDDKLKPGPDPDTARRLDFASRRVPEKVTGEILVDGATGVVLTATAQARFSVPGLAGEPPATLDLDVNFDVAPDPSVKVTAPTDVDQTRLAHAVTDPLWFLGDGPPPARAVEEEPPAADQAGDDAPDDPAEAPAPAKPAPKK